MAPSPKILHDMKWEWMVMVGQAYGLYDLDPKSRRDDLEDKVARAMAATDCPGVCLGKCDPSQHQFIVSGPPFTIGPPQHAADDGQDEDDTYDSDSGQGWVRTSRHRQRDRSDRRVQDGASG